MNSLSLGDLANSFMLQQRGSALKAEMSRLTQELTSGQVSDVKTVLAGNYSYLTDIEAGMSTLQGYKVATTEAAQFSGTIQSVLENVQESISNFGNDLILVANGGLDSVAVQSSSEGFAVLKRTISALNSNHAGRSLFAGAATNKPPLGSAEELMGELQTLLTGVVGPDAKISAIDAWFDDPTGFETQMYKGSSASLSPFHLSKSDDVVLDVKATDPELKNTLKHLAIAAIASDDTLDVGAVERQALLQMSGEGLLRDQEGITALRAQIGYSEARIDSASTRNASESLSLEYAKGSLLAADPYETATRLEEVQFQLQSLYTITAKTSQLSLVNFL